MNFFSTVSLKKYSIIFIVLMSFFATQDVVAQCAMCRAVLESEGNQSVAKGINNCIVYLMAIPYVLIAAIGIAIYRKMRKEA